MFDVWSMVSFRKLDSGQLFNKTNYTHGVYSQTFYVTQNDENIQTFYRWPFLHLPIAKIIRSSRWEYFWYDPHQKKTKINTEKFIVSNSFVACNEHIVRRRVESRIVVQKNSKKKINSFLFADREFGFRIFHGKLRLVADHSFIYALVNRLTDSTLFIGRFNQPSDDANKNIPSTVSSVDPLHNEGVTYAPKIFETDQTTVDSIGSNDRRYTTTYSAETNPNTNRTPINKNPWFTSTTQAPVIYSSPDNWQYIITSSHHHIRHHLHFSHSSFTPIHWERNDQTLSRFGSIFPSTSNSCQCNIRINALDD